MSKNDPTVEGWIDQQGQALKASLPAKDLHKKIRIPVITVSMEAGSGGFLIAQEAARLLGFDLYHREILRPMAHSAEVSLEVLAAMEETRLSGVHDLVASLLDKKYLPQEEYRRALEEIVYALGQVGHAVIVGRGANFILKPEERFAIRVIAPQKMRVKNVAFAHGVSLREAEKRIKNRDSRRKAFVRENFSENIEDPSNYDLILNTARLDALTGAEAIIGALLGSQKNHAFSKAESYILRKQT
ncbi:MAG: cytidylate kinase-like family protein [Desulfobacterales bacterium]